MLINKWLVIDSMQRPGVPDKSTGACILFNGQPTDQAQLLNALQEKLWNIPFTVLIPENASFRKDDYGPLAENMIRLFFQPSYYTYDFHPVIFIAHESPALTDFMKLVDQKSREQGFKAIAMHQFQTGRPGLTSLITSKGTDPDALIRLWKKEYLANKNPSEIHLIVASGENQPEVFNDIIEAEKKLKETEDYSITRFLYTKQREIEEYRHQLYLKSVSEKNAQLYLSIQKEERASGLKWYYNEYEILPRWYKQFGHILKVIMGKRSFKSLFSDKVKKYKD